METKKRGRALLSVLLPLVLLYLGFLLIPAAVYAASREKGEEPPEKEEISSAPEFPDFLEGASLPGGKTAFSLYDAATKTTLSLSPEELLPGALACEMDPASPKEALKAQAVAILTLYCYRRANEEDMICDTEQWTSYTTVEQMKGRWGDRFEEYYGLLKEASEEAGGQILTWEGKPICAAYFAISSGNTEAAENVWAENAGPDFPYLCGVASPGDAFSQGYLSRAVFTQEEFRQAASAYCKDPALDLSGPAETWLTDLERTPSGYVKQGKLGGVPLSGGELRAAFSLRSACFTLEFADGVFTFTVKGWGHGVGMSQVGAAFLAAQGADYGEILSHYYPGTVLTSR